MARAARNADDAAGGHLTVMGGSSPRARSLEISAPERELAVRASDGDRDASRQLLVIVSPHVIRTVVGVLGPGDPEAEDLAQDALVALLRALPAFRAEASIRWFATRIASRIALSAVRRRGRRRRVEDALAHAVEERSPDNLARAQRMLLIRAAMAAIPPEQAETLALRWLLGHSLPEVAEITSVPINTVRSRVRLARRALLRRLRQHPTWRHVGTSADLDQGTP